MPKLTTAERLNLLVDWVNEDGWMGDGHPDHKSMTQVAVRLRGFIESFDGSEAAGFIRVEPLGDYAGVLPEGIILPKTRKKPQPKPPPPELLDEREALWVLHTMLDDLLRCGFPVEPGVEPAGWTELFALSSLRFGLAPQRSKRGRWQTKSGAYVLRLAGNRKDLVRFLVLHLLRTQGGGILARCPAPAPYSSSQRCNRFLVPASRGRPRTFCSDTCRIRDYSRELDAKGIKS